MFGLRKKENKVNSVELTLLMFVFVSVCFFAFKGGEYFINGQVAKKVNEAVDTHAKLEDKERVDRGNRRCESLVSGLKSRWNNILDVYYKEATNGCIVKYKLESGEEEEAPLEEMRDI